MHVLRLVSSLRPDDPSLHAGTVQGSALAHSEGVRGGGLGGWGSSGSPSGPVRVLEWKPCHPSANFVAETLGHAMVLPTVLYRQPFLRQVGHRLQVQQLAAGCAGFMMYKLAVVGVLTVPALFQWWTPSSEN